MLAETAKDKSFSKRRIRKELFGPERKWPPKKQHTGVPELKGKLDVLDDRFVRVYKYFGLVHKNPSKVCHPENDLFFLAPP